MSATRETQEYQYQTGVSKQKKPKKITQKNEVIP